MQIPSLTQQTFTHWAARQPRLRLLIITLSALTVLWSPLLTTLLAGWGLTYFMSYRLLPRDYAYSKTFRLLTGLFIYVSFLQAAILLVWLLNVNFPLDGAAVVATLLVAGCSSYFTWHHSHTSRTKLQQTSVTPSATRDDIVALLLAGLITVAAIGAPLLSAAHTPSRMLALIGNNSDDAAHLAYINDRLQFNRGVLYRSDAQQQVRSEGQINTYPAGWHSANAIIIKAVAPAITPGIASAVAYALSKTAWFFLLAYFFFFAGLYSYAKLAPSNTRYDLEARVGVSSLLIWASVIFLINIQSQGFYSYIPQLIATLLLFLVLAGVAATKDITRGFGALLIVVAGGCLSWFLILPAFLLAAVAALLQLAGGLKRAGEAVVQSIIPWWPLYLIFGTAVIVQYYVMRQATNGISFLSGILLNGSIVTYPDQFLHLLVLGLGIVFFLRQPKAHAMRTAAAATLLGMLGFALILFVIQKYYTGQNMYYFYKVLYAFYILAIPLAAAGAVAAFTTRFHTERSLRRLLFGSFAIIAILYVPLLPTTVSYLRGARTLAPTNAAAAYRYLDAGDNQPDQYYDKQYVFFFVPGQTENNDVSTLLVKSNKIDSRCFNEVRPLLWSSTSLEPILQTTNQACDAPVVIVTNQQHARAFQEAAAKSTNRVNIQVQL